MRQRAFFAGVLVVFATGALLRTAWLRSDPPTAPTVGVVWHDEGAWVHNARNRALWGVWRTDDWNPVFLAPVFTGLEYAAFRAFGVGTWQARTVPVASGLLALGFLIAGLTAATGRRAALIGGALLATNFAFVMWNRAALMESTMTALMVVSWSAYALAERQPRWGLAAGIAAGLAWFTKASAAFFIAAIVLDAAITILRDMPPSPKPQAPSPEPGSRAAAYTLGGLVVTFAVIGVAFVLPHWSEYRFYNWQMSVLRKPEYTLRALADRASWLPLVQDFFMWMWPVLALASVALLGIVSRWRTAKPAERLLVWWVVIGLFELVVHDSGNMRRYVMFIPASIALAATALGTGRAAVVDGSAQSPRARWLAVPLLLGLGYLLAGSALRAGFLDEIHAGHLHRVALLAAIAATAGATVIVMRWSAIVGRLSRAGPPASVAALVILSTIAGDAVHFGSWAHARQERNYAASVEVGRLLAPGTFVQGKLANGLSLENLTRPLFIGHDFGNYDDRLQRDDVRYILTYVSPNLGYESQEGSGLIQEILDHYPRQAIVATFVVRETGPADRAALIDKAPGSDPRARD